MFASKEACVREIVGRVMSSCLEDKESLDAAFNLIRLYRETPNAFGNFREMEEPLNISASFPWDEAGREGSEYWQNVNAALVGVFQEMTDGGDCDALIADWEEDEGLVELVDAEPIDEGTTHFNALGHVVEGWGLLNRETENPRPVVCKTRSEARGLKTGNESVVRVALFTIDKSNSAD